MEPAPRILVVEDDVDLRRSLAELLEEEGYEVSCATNGAEALRALEVAAAPSAILLDLHMPVLDGFGFRSAQRRDPRIARIPTVVISAALAANAREIAELEPAAFLAKPFDAERLIATLGRLC